MEHIVRLIENEFNHSERFLIEMAGITYPDSTYHVYRPDSLVYCFEYVIEGTGQINCDGKSFTVHQGDVYLLPARATHNYRSRPKDPMKKIWVNMSGSLCDSLYRLYDLDGTYHYPNRNLLHSFQKLVDLCEHTQYDIPYLEMRAPLIVHEMFATLSPAPTRRQTGNRIAVQAKTFIDRHASEQITASQVANSLGISVSQMNRLFISQYGQSPMKYHATQRIKTAESLLRNTGMQVREISQMLQYADEHYFSNSFRKATGLSPKAYRQGNHLDSTGTEPDD